jgi:cytochrome P450
MSAEEARSCPIHFDHHSTEFARDWAGDYRRLRARSPRAWSDAYDGFWVATDLSDIIGVAQQPEVFSAHKDIDPETGAATGGVTIPPSGAVRGIPNEADNPEWEGIRRLINRRFAPRAIEERRERAKRFAAAVIDEVIEKGELDFVDHLTNPVPALVTMEIFGFPLHEWPRIADPFHKMVYTPIDDPSFPETIRGLDYFRQRVGEEIALRRQEPKDDFLTVLATGTIDGELLSETQIKDLSFNILAGGVDTTTALTSSTLVHLGRHPQDRQRLIDDPDSGALPYSARRYRGEWLEDRQGRADHAGLRRGQSRSSRVRRSRYGEARSLSQQACRLRRRHAPLPGLVPRADDVASDDRRGARPPA